jgi:uncharacterized protein YbjT (DUF2867 family)
MILVAGSSEILEYEICFTLASQGISIRALILNHHDPAWVECLKNFGAMLALGDLQDLDFLSDLYLGVRAVICSPVFLSTGQLDLIGMLNLIDTAAAAGVLRFVYISFADENGGSCEEAKTRQAIEKGIIRSGVRYTILQAGDHLSSLIGSAGNSFHKERIKELARLVTQVLKEPALENTSVMLSDQAADLHHQTAVAGTIDKVVKVAGA